jgi:hypothetical protein
MDGPLAKKFNECFGRDALLLFRNDSPESTGFPIFRAPGETDESWKKRSTNIKNLNSATASWVEVLLSVVWENNEERVNSELRAFHEVRTQEIADKAMLHINVMVWRTLRPDIINPIVGKA